MEPTLILDPGPDSPSGAGRGGEEREGARDAHLSFNVVRDCEVNQRRHQAIEQRSLHHTKVGEGRRAGQAGHLRKNV